MYGFSPRSSLDNGAPQVSLSQIITNLPDVQTLPSIDSSESFTRTLCRIRTRSRLAGFSLVEVVMAVGVAAFALVALLGLLPSGLKTFKSTMNTAVGSQIAQRVFNDMQIADWKDLTNSTRFFDEQGTELTNSNAVNCIYWVSVQIGTNSGGGNSTSFLGNTSTNLATVTVMVANNPGNGLGTNATNGANPNVQTFTTLIGRNK